MPDTPSEHAPKLVPANSPIECLLPAIGDAMLRIAPEREKKLRDLVRDMKLQLLIDDGFTAKSDSSVPSITLGFVFLEQLWALSYAYYVLYTEMADARARDSESMELDLTATQRQQDAVTLMRWALEGMLPAPKRKLPWLTGLPRPSANPPQGSDVHVVNEVFLCAVAFIQHHELAHLRKHHSKGSPEANIEQEREADQDAADWVLSGVAAEDPRFRKRVLGMAVVLTALAVDQVYNLTSAQDHPQPFNRLYHGLDRVLEDPNHLGWAIAASMLSVHIQHRGVTVDPLPEHHTWKDVADRLVDVLSRMVAQ